MERVAKRGAESGLLVRELRVKIHIGLWRSEIHSEDKRERGHTSEVQLPTMMLSHHFFPGSGNEASISLLDMVLNVGADGTIFSSITSRAWMVGGTFSSKSSDGNAKSCLTRSSAESSSRPNALTTESYIAFAPWRSAGFIKGGVAARQMSLWASFSSDVMR